MEMAAEILDHGFLGDTEPGIYIPAGVGAEQQRPAEEESGLPVFVLFCAATSHDQNNSAHWEH